MFPVAATLGLTFTLSTPLLPPRCLLCDAGRSRKTAMSSSDGIGVTDRSGSLNPAPFCVLFSRAAPVQGAKSATRGTGCGVRVGASAGPHLSVSSGLSSALGVAETNAEDVPTQLIVWVVAQLFRAQQAVQRGIELPRVSLRGRGQSPRPGTESLTEPGAAPIPGELRG